MSRERLQRGYDPRGTYPDQVNKENYYKLGVFFGKFLEGKTVSIGYDARNSSVDLKNELIKGLLETGKTVIELGLCSTDMLTFSTGKYPEIDAGIMITASHNPPNYNGLKVCRKYAEPVNIQEISGEIIEFINNFDQSNEQNLNGKLIQKNIENDRIDHILSFVNPEKIKNLKIVVDAGNGTAGLFVGELLEKLGCEVIPMYFDPDGNFPNHEANPLKPENVQDLIQKVQETGADLGAAFDGDADRVMVCDETGQMLNGSIMTAIIAENILKKNPGAKIIQNTVCGRIVADTVEKNGGILLKSKVGHAHIKKTMKNDPEILFAGEHSAHYFFKTNRNADSGSIALVTMLEVFSQNREKISDMRKSFDKYFAKAETNFTVQKFSAIYDALKKQFSNGEIDENDGLTINFDTRRFNMRPSSNEPLLRLNIEAEDEKTLEENFGKIKSIIENF